MDIRCNECKLPLGGRKRATSHSQATGHNAHPAFECKECRVAFKRLMCYEAHLMQCTKPCPPPTLLQTDSPPRTPTPTTPPPMVLHPKTKPRVAATVLPVDQEDGSAADTETELESTRGMFQSATLLPNALVLTVDHRSECCSSEQDVAVALSRMPL
ncbi:hypothetical protein BD413DRAFT_1711 [Trametes elegans]|nr:hypothetical protein BD413DRAFT_1711 [Trametes elegans]